MPRMADYDCEICDHKLRDVFMQDAPDVLYHDAGGGVQHPMRFVYIPLARAAEWSDADAVVVYRKPNGEFVYPARNDQPTPKGCERVVMKSLRAVERFERETGTRNEAIHYDRGSGTRRPDDRLPSPYDRMPSEEKRLAAFMRGWRGDR